jgi:hypothetical protein
MLLLLSTNRAACKSDFIFEIDIFLFKCILKRAYNNKLTFTNAPELPLSIPPLGG